MTGCSVFRRAIGRRPGHCLIIMVKEPRLGRVKTRLARDAGIVTATFAYRSLLSHTVQRLRHGPWQTLLAVTPRQALASRMLPGGTARLSQGEGDLGQRMGRAFRSAAPRPALLIGTDIAAITPAMIRTAFHKLAGHDAVFGPAYDGGYWLVGLRHVKHMRGVFENVRWSSRHALADTMGNLVSARAAVVQTLHDIDDGADLRQARSVIGRRVLPVVS